MLSENLLFLSKLGSTFFLPKKFDSQKRSTENFACKLTFRHRRIFLSFFAKKIRPKKNRRIFRPKKIRRRIFEFGKNFPSNFSKLSFFKFDGFLCKNLHAFFLASKNRQNSTPRNLNPIFWRSNFKDFSWKFDVENFWHRKVLVRRFFRKFCAEFWFLHFSKIRRKILHANWLFVTVEFFWVFSPTKFDPKKFDAFFVPKTFDVEFSILKKTSLWA